MLYYLSLRAGTLLPYYLLRECSGPAELAASCSISAHLFSYLNSSQCQKVCQHNSLLYVHKLHAVQGNLVHLIFMLGVGLSPLS